MTIGELKQCMPAGTSQAVASEMLALINERGYTKAETIPSPEWMEMLDKVLNRTKASANISTNAPIRIHYPAASKTMPAGDGEQTAQSVEHQNTEIIEILKGIRVMLRLIFWVPLAAGIVLLVYLGK